MLPSPAAAEAHVVRGELQASTSRRLTNDLPVLDLKDTVGDVCDPLIMSDD